ncbi:putative phage related protein [Escherichia coli]|uniref:Putative phage related protein n=1 Tax=Escherichia coli TaxID=562 RepID=A0A376U6I6_ECOLX|nr:putative phage related protein [Escherichia coli]
MNNVFLYRMPVGIAGAVSRPQDLTVEPVVLKSDNAFAAYGWLVNTMMTVFSCRWQMVIPQTR